MGISYSLGPTRDFRRLCPRLTQWVKSPTPDKLLDKQREPEKAEVEISSSPSSACISIFNEAKIRRAFIFIYT